MKRVLSIILATLLILSVFAACTGNNSSSRDTPQSTSSPTNGSSSLPKVESEVKEDPGAPNTESVTFTMFIDMPWFFFDKWGTDPVSQKMTEITGVSFELTRATDSSQLPMLISADDLPEFVYTDNKSIMNELKSEEKCYPYNELVKQYGVNIYATDTEIANNTANDGNYYCLLNAFTSQEAIDAGGKLVSPGTRGLAYRVDIWEDIGSPELNSIEDVENALLAAHQMYPDIVPLLIEGTYYMGYFREQMGIQDSQIVYNKDGDPIHRLSDPAQKDFYALMNRFYREGLIIPEATTYSFDRFREVADSGMSFMQPRASDEAISSNSKAQQNGSGLKWKLVDHVLSDDALYTYMGIGWAGTFITKNNHDPQRAIEFMSWCRSEEGRQLTAWGIPGEHWEYDANGQTVYTDAYREGVAAGKQKQNDFGIDAWIFGDQGDETSFIDHAITDPDMQDQQSYLEDVVRHYRVISDLYFCTPVEGDALNMYSAINDMENTEQLKVIFAETDEEFENAYASMLSQAETLGLSKLNEWMKETLATHNG